MQNPPANSLTTPVALIILATAIVISALIFVFVGNSQSKEQPLSLANNSVAVAGTPPENGLQFNRLPQPDVDRHARPNLGKLRAFMAGKKAGSKPRFLGKGKPGLDGERQGKPKHRFSGKGKPGLDGERQGNSRPRFSGKGKPGLDGERQGNSRPRFSGKGKPGLDDNKR
ncbi:MAG: hypothetical protein VX724_01850 [Chloroflexota bacterium]|nr:hypothetical protein [Chloroflexota bacterium]